MQETCDSFTMNETSPDAEPQQQIGILSEEIRVRVLALTNNDRFTNKDFSAQWLSNQLKLDHDTISPVISELLRTKKIQQTISINGEQYYSLITRT